MKLQLKHDTQQEYPQHAPSNKIIDFPLPDELLDSQEKLRDIEDWNKFILQEIDQCEHPTVLGLLPVSETNSEQIVAEIHKETAKHENKDNLIWMYPAAVCYAMAYCLASSKTGGNSLWKEINERLCLDCTTKWNTTFQDALRKLPSPGVLTGVISKKAPAVNFQAGIKRCWVPSLTTALRKMGHLPSIEDNLGVKNYAYKLSEKCTSQTALKEALEGELGSLIVEKLIHFDNGNEQVIPDHLVESFRSTQINRGKNGFKVREPFLKFNPSERIFQIEFPKLNSSNKHITTETLWVWLDKKNPAICYTPPELVSVNQEVRVDLTSLNGMGNRSYRISTLIQKGTPFRLFKEKSGREFPIASYKQTVSVPTGNYYIIIEPNACAVSEEDDQCFSVDKGNLFRYWDDGAIEISDDEPSLIIESDGSQFTIEAKREFEFSLDSNSESYIKTRDTGCPLVFGLVPLSIKGADDGSQISAIIETKDYESYNFNFNVREVWCENFQCFFDSLEDDPVKVKIILQDGSQKSVVEFVYWKGLLEYKHDFGFTLNSFAGVESIDWFTKMGKQLVFDNSSADLFRSVETSSAGLIELPKPGVRVIVSDDNSERKISAEDTIFLNKSENKVVTFETNGLEDWTIFGDSFNDPIAKLGRNNGVKKRGRSQTRKESFLNYLDSRSRLGTIFARNENGVQLTLFSMVRPAFVEGFVKWNRCRYEFDLPAFSILELGYTINDLVGDYPVSLIQSKNGFKEFDQWIANDSLCVSGRRKGEVIQIEIEPKKENLPFGRSIISFFVKVSEGRWQLLNCRDIADDKSKAVRFPFFGFPKQGTSIEVKVKEYLLLHRFLQDQPPLTETEPLWGDHGFYNRNYFKPTIEDIFRSHPEEFWKSAAIDLEILSTTKTDKVPSKSLFAQVPTLLTIFSSECRFSVCDSLTRRTLNLSDPINVSNEFSAHFNDSKFLLGKYCTHLKEHYLDCEVTRERSIRELLSVQHFSFCVYKTQKRCDFLKEDDLENLQVKAADAFDRLWCENIRVKERKQFNAFLAQHGFETFDDIYSKMWFPFKPSEGELAYQVSYLVFRIALISRLAGNNRMQLHEFTDQFNRIFHNNGFASIIKLAPELLAFYLLMFDQAIQNIARDEF